MRRLSFRLRTTFLVVSIICVVLAVWAHEQYLTACEQQAFNEVASRGGYVIYDRYHKTTEVYFSAAGRNFVACGQTRVIGPSTSGSFGDNDIPMLRGIRRLVSVDWTGSKVTLAGAKSFSNKYPAVTVTLQGNTLTAQ